MINWHVKQEISEANLFTALCTDLQRFHVNKEDSDAHITDITFMFCEI